jgi:hypothetical protein
MSEIKGNRIQLPKLMYFALVFLVLTNILFHMKITFILLNNPTVGEIVYKYFIKLCNTKKLKTSVTCF